MSFLWLMLQILPLLLIVAAVFYWLGLRQPRTDLSESLASKQDALDREQTKADALSRQLTMAEEQIAQLSADYEKLQRGAIPRRLLSDAENEIIKLQRQLASLGAIDPTSQPEAPQAGPAPVSPRASSGSKIPPMPANDPAPESISPTPTPVEIPPLTMDEPPATVSLETEVVKPILVEVPLPSPDPDPQVESAEPPLQLTQPIFSEAVGKPKPPPKQKRRRKSK